MAVLTAYEATLASLQLVAGVLYTYVGAKVGRRRVSPDAQLAVRLFQFWWYGLAALSFFSPVLLVGQALFGDLPIPIWLTVVNVLLTLICAAIVGLCYYLLYLYTGKRWLIVPVSLFYGLLAFGLLTLIAYLNPHLPYVTDDQGHHPTYDHDLRGTWVSAAIGFGLILPPFGAALAYLLLFFRVQDRTARYRIALVSGSFIAWFGSSLIAQLLRIPTQTEAWRITSLLISLAAAVVVLLAYLPPRWVQKKYEVESIAAEATG